MLLLNHAGISVRFVLLLVMLLLLTGHVAVRLDPAATHASGVAESREWVRTLRGWEPLDSLRASSSAPEVFHPALVAGGQLFGSLLALLALAKAKE